MPLRLIECVLPWLVGSLSEEEARSFLYNMHMAGSTSVNFFCYTLYNYCIVSFVDINLSIINFLTCAYLPMQPQHQTLRWLPFFLVGHVKVVQVMFVCPQLQLGVALPNCLQEAKKGLLNHVLVPHPRLSKVLM